MTEKMNNTTNVDTASHPCDREYRRAPKDRQDGNNALRSMLKNAGRHKEHFSAEMVDTAIDYLELVRKYVNGVLYKSFVDFFPEVVEDPPYYPEIDRDALGHVKDVIDEFHDVVYAQLSQSIATLEHRYLGCIVQGLGLSEDEARMFYEEYKSAHCRRNNDEGSALW